MPPGSLAGTSRAGAWATRTRAMFRALLQRRGLAAEGGCFETQWSTPHQSTSCSFPAIHCFLLAAASILMLHHRVAAASALFEMLSLPGLSCALCGHRRECTHAN